MRGYLWAVALVIASSLVACSAPVRAPTATLDFETASALPSERPSSSPATAPSEEPITYPPDNVWRLLATAAGSMSGATDAQSASELADTVVVGQIRGVSAGEGYGPTNQDLGWYAIASIEVQSVVTGEDPGPTLEIPFMLVMGGDRFPQKELADVQRSIPTDPALLFLQSWESYFDMSATEVPSWLKNLDRPDLYRTIGVDGAIRVVDGELDPPTHEESWATSLKGVTLDDVSQMVAPADG